MGQELTDRKSRIQAKLTQIFQPDLLEIVDESAKHAGHAGAAPGGETHYRVHIQAEAFADLSRLERHRRINDALQDEFDTGLHALSIKANGP